MFLAGRRYNSSILRHVTIALPDELSAALAAPGQDLDTEAVRIVRLIDELFAIDSEARMTNLDHAAPRPAQQESSRATGGDQGGSYGSTC